MKKDGLREARSCVGVDCCAEPSVQKTFNRWFCLLRGVGLRGEVPQDDANNPPLEGEGCTPQKILFLSAAKSQERIKFPLQFNARRACFFGGIATSLSD